MSPKDQDFDWVAARIECDLEFQFKNLWLDAKKNASARQDFVPESEPLQFEVGDIKIRSFEVSRRRASGDEWVTFMLDLDSKCIVVNYSDGKEMFKARLFLNVKGDCRYRIAVGGPYEGEYCRWQVLRLAFEQIFFGSLPPGVRAPGDSGITI